MTNEIPIFFRQKYEEKKEAGRVMTTTWSIPK